VNSDKPYAASSQPFSFGEGLKKRNYIIFIQVLSFGEDLGEAYMKYGYEYNGQV
jgi:hypothetical protein